MMRIKFPIRTKRLCIVPFEWKWTQAVLQTFTAEITRWQYPEPYQSEEDVRAWMSQQLQEMEQERCLELVILDEDDHFLGGFEVMGLQQRYPEVGLWLRKEAQGQGYGKEALRVMLERLNESYRFEGYLYEADIRNLPSIRLAQSFAYDRLGRMTVLTAAGKDLQLEQCIIQLSDEKPHHVYIIRCEDQTLYTGWTKDIAARMKKHAAGKGAKYTRTHRPEALVYQEDFVSSCAARKREYAIKRLKRAEKESLIRETQIPPIPIATICDTISTEVKHMKISEAIQKIKQYHNGIDAFTGKPIDEATTRDKILYGNPDQELKGIVTTCYASVDVIREAIKQGANLIICHEALFWNHGDHTDWLQDNKTFQAKTALLDEGGIVVWRDHDYIHSGIPMKDGTYTDGIFYGLMKVLGWDAYLTGDPAVPLHFDLPETTVGELGKTLMSRLHLNGIKLIGRADSPVHRVWVPGHIDGRKDNEILKTIEETDIDTVITLECTDYTVSEYIRDSLMVGRPKTIMAVGHFNTEEPGMEYMVEWLPEALGETVPTSFVPCCDMYNFL